MMAFIPRKNRKGIISKEVYNCLLSQKTSIEANYSCFSCRVNKVTQKLICKGKVPSNLSFNDYEIEIRQKPFQIPVVFVRKPEIRRLHEIHMFSNSSLCLYHKDQVKWDKNTMIAEVTIPRIAEWVMYYELWLLTGEWEGPEYPHQSL